MRGYPQFPFRIITLVEICFSRISIQPRKNTFELVGTVLKKSQEMKVFRCTSNLDIQQEVTL